MSGNFDRQPEFPTKINRAEVATNELSALNTTHLTKETRMPVKAEYTGPEAQSNTNWKSIGSVAAALVKKAAQK